MKRFYRVNIWPLLVIVLIAGGFWETTGIASDSHNASAPKTIVSQTIEELADGGTLNKAKILAAPFFTENMYAPDDLSDAGKQILQDFADHVRTAHGKYAKQFPGLLTTITISVAAYSKQEAFEEDFSLLHEISVDGNVQIPTQDPERRQFLNYCLSAFRSRTLGERLQQALVDYDQQHPLLKIQYIIEGKGEQQSDEQADSKSVQQYAFSAEIKVRVRGPRVTHPTDIILYEVQEEE